MSKGTTNTDPVSAPGPSGETLSGDKAETPVSKLEEELVEGKAELEKLEMKVAGIKKMLKQKKKEEKNEIKKKEKKTKGKEIVTDVDDKNEIKEKEENTESKNTEKEEISKDKPSELDGQNKQESSGDDGVKPRQIKPVLENESEKEVVSSQASTQTSAVPVVAEAPKRISRRWSFISMPHRSQAKESDIGKDILSEPTPIVPDYRFNSTMQGHGYPLAASENTSCPVVAPFSQDKFGKGKDAKEKGRLLGLMGKVRHLGTGSHAKDATTSSNPTTPVVKRIEPEPVTASASAKASETVKDPNPIAAAAPKVAKGLVDNAPKIAKAVEDNAPKAAKVAEDSIIKLAKAMENVNPAVAKGLEDAAPKVGKTVKDSAPKVTKAMEDSAPKLAQKIEGMAAAKPKEQTIENVEDISIKEAKEMTAREKALGNLPPPTKPRKYESTESIKIGNDINLPSEEAVSVVPPLNPREGSTSGGASTTLASGTFASAVANSAPKVTKAVVDSAPKVAESLVNVAPDLAKKAGISAPMVSGIIVESAPKVSRQVEEYASTMATKGKEKPVSEGDVPPVEVPPEISSPCEIAKDADAVPAIDKDITSGKAEYTGDSTFVEDGAAMKTAPIVAAGLVASTLAMGQAVSTSTDDKEKEKMPASDMKGSSAGETKGEVCDLAKAKETSDTARINVKETGDPIPTKMKGEAKLTSENAVPSKDKNTTDLGPVLSSHSAPVPLPRTAPKDQGPQIAPYKSNNGYSRTSPSHDEIGQAVTKDKVSPPSPNGNVVAIPPLTAIDVPGYRFITTMQGHGYPVTTSATGGVATVTKKKEKDKKGLLHTLSKHMSFTKKKKHEEDAIAATEKPGMVTVLENVGTGTQVPEYRFITTMQGHGYPTMIHESPKDEEIPAPAPKTKGDLPASNESKDASKGGLMGLRMMKSLTGIFRRTSMDKQGEGAKEQTPKGEIGDLGASTSGGSPIAKEETAAA